MIKEQRTITQSSFPNISFKPLELNDSTNRVTEINGLESIDYVTAQAQLAKTMRRVCENNSPIAIDGIGKDRVVIMPLEQFEKLNKKSANSD